MVWHPTNTTNRQLPRDNPEIRAILSRYLSLAITSPFKCRLWRNPYETLMLRESQSVKPEHSRMWYPRKRSIPVRDLVDYQSKQCIFASRKFTKGTFRKGGFSNSDSKDFLCSSNQTTLDTYSFYIWAPEEHFCWCEWLYHAISYVYLNAALE